MTDEQGPVSQRVGLTPYEVNAYACIHRHAEFNSNSSCVIFLLRVAAPEVLRLFRSRPSGVRGGQRGCSQVAASADMNVGCEKQTKESVLCMCCQECKNCTLDCHACMHAYY